MYLSNIRTPWYSSYRYLSVEQVVFWTQYSLLVQVVVDDSTLHWRLWIQYITLVKMNENRDNDNVSWSRKERSSHIVTMNQNNCDTSVQSNVHGYNKAEKLPIGPITSLASLCFPEISFVNVNGFVVLIYIINKEWDKKWAHTRYIYIYISRWQNHLHFLRQVCGKSQVQCMVIGHVCNVSALHPVLLLQIQQLSKCSLKPMSPLYCYLHVHVAYMLLVKIMPCVSERKIKSHVVKHG